MAAVAAQPWNQAPRRWEDHGAHARPGGHVGPQSYISPTARLADGRSYLDRTTETVIEFIRRDCRTT